MPKSPLIAVVALSALAVTGCTATAESPDAAKVPRGVATMYQTMEEEIAKAGGETATGPWRVGYIVEAAEPWFEQHGEHEKFRTPQPGETHHIEILPFETATGRLVPALPIRVEVIAEDGSTVDEKDLNFYYGEFFHYANNFSVPEPGTYTIRATLAAPTFMRHGDRAEGPALASGATATFEDVELSTE